MTNHATIARTYSPQTSERMPIVIDDDLRSCVMDLASGEERHEAKQEGRREAYSPGEIQIENLEDLINAHGVSRPIYVWKRGEEWVIVDGHKTYEVAERLGKSYEVKIVDLDSLEEAKAWRWHVNVAANRRLTEDVTVMLFMYKFADVIEGWKKQARSNQGKSKLLDKNQKMDCEQMIAKVCQTNTYHVKQAKSLCGFAEKATKLKDKPVGDLTDQEKDLIKKIEDNIAATLSGKRSAKTAVDNIKGNKTRSGKKNKGSKPCDLTGKVKRYVVGEHCIELVDSLKRIKEMDEGSFDHLIGSPPYFRANINYGYDIPWLKTWDAYCEAMKAYIHEAYRIIPDGGSIVLQVDDTHDPDKEKTYHHTDMITRICDDLGMVEAGRIVWYKQNVSGKKGSRGSVNKLHQCSNHEYVVAFCKGEKHVDYPSFVNGEENHLRLSTWIANSEVEELNAEHWEIMKNFWSIAPKWHKDHPVPYPDQLAYRMLTRFTSVGSTVFDPWTGTGTTGVQCAMTGRKFLGCEMGVKYAGIANKAMEKACEASNDLARQRLARIEGLLRSYFG